MRACSWGPWRRWGHQSSTGETNFGTKCHSPFCCFSNWKRNPVQSEPHRTEISTRTFVKTGKNSNSANLTYYAGDLGHNSPFIPIILQMSQHIEIWQRKGRVSSSPNNYTRKGLADFPCCIFLLADLCFQTTGEHRLTARCFRDGWGAGGWGGCHSQQQVIQS